MVTIKDEVEQFKRDLRSYKYHQKKAVEFQEKLEVLAVEMQGVSSPAFKETMCENAGNPKSDKKIQLLCEEEFLLKELKKHQTEIDRLDDMLKLLPETKKKILIDIYVKRKNIDYVASRIYCSNRKVRYDVNEMIKWVLQENEKLDELNRLHTKIT